MEQNEVESAADASKGSTESSNSAVSASIANNSHEQKKKSDFLDPQRLNNSEEAKVSHGSIGKWTSPAKVNKINNKLGGGAAATSNLPKPIRLNLDDVDSTMMRLPMQQTNALDDPFMSQFAPL